MVPLLRTFGQEGEPLGLGSAFVVDSAGLLVTNYHVIEGAIRGIAEFRNGARYRIKSGHSVNCRAGLALVEIESTDSFEALLLSPPGETAVGDFAIVIGVPAVEGTAVEPTQFSLSTGVVSGIREFEDVSLVQTTAAMSPGSSGGPVLNLNGEVIGVVRGGLPTGQSLNYAISSEEVLPLLETAIKKELSEYSSLEGKYRGERRLDAVVGRDPYRLTVSVRVKGSTILVTRGADYYRGELVYKGEGIWSATVVSVKGETQVALLFTGQQLIGEVQRKHDLKLGTGETWVASK
jgi:S1-C subfamily serine protease